MAVDLTLTSKNAVSLTLDAKTGTQVTWAEYDDTYQEAEGTWAVPNTPSQALPAKNVVTITLDTKL